MIPVAPDASTRVPPPMCAKWMAEFTGKQQTLKSFFGNKAPSDNAAVLSAPPAPFERKRSAEPVAAVTKHAKNDVKGQTKLAGFFLPAAAATTPQQNVLPPLPEPSVPLQPSDGSGSATSSESSSESWPIEALDEVVASAAAETKNAWNRCGFTKRC